MLYKRPDSPFWWTRFTIHGRRIRRSTETHSKREAALFESRERARLWRELKLGEQPYTFEDLALRWLEERDHKRSLATDKSHIRWLRPLIGTYRLTEIDRDCIETLRRRKKKETSAVSANRVMSLLRSMLKAARDDWEWIDVIPKVPMYTIEEPEPRWVTREQFEVLAGHMPPHLELIARFAVNTGLRSANVLGLRWDQINMEQNVVIVPALRAKARKPIRVPLNAEARCVIERVRGLGESGAYVFTYEGHPLTTIKRAWNRAVGAAGLQPLKFHDLRHTWASWHVQAGTPLSVVQELGAWSDIRTVQRYAHLSPGHLAEWAENI